MKKIFLIIILLSGALYSRAQDTDSIQVQPSATAPDTISKKVDELQHNYAFLHCKYELLELQMQVANELQDITSQARFIALSPYSTSLHKANVKLYNSSEDLWNTLKEKFDAVKINCLLYVEIYDFSDKEINYIYSEFNYFTKMFKYGDKQLENLYESIRAYKRSGLY